MSPLWVTYATLVEQANLDIPEEKLRAFGLEQNPPARGDRIAPLNHHFSVYLVGHLAVVGDQFQQVPFAVRIFHLADRVAIADLIPPGALAPAREAAAPSALGTRLGFATHGER